MSDVDIERDWGVVAGDPELPASAQATCPKCEKSWVTSEGIFSFKCPTCGTLVRGPAARVLCFD